DRGVNALRVTRVDGEARDLLGVTTAKMRPRLSRVRRLVDAVADGEVGPLQALSAPDVERVGARRGDGGGAARPPGLVVPPGPPPAARGPPPRNGPIIRQRISENSPSESGCAAAAFARRRSAPR